MNANIAAIAYLVSGVLFILALRGLSSPETSRQGNTFGMVGMALAIGVTLLTLGTTGALDSVTLALIAGGVIVNLGEKISRKTPSSPWEMLAQAMICSNEFVYLD